MGMEALGNGLTTKTQLHYFPKRNSWSSKQIGLWLREISRECLDRLTKLENENRELRKQYQVLEAQIQPFVKSLHAHEPVCVPTEHPENGKTFVYGVGRAKQHFDSQIRQLISVLVHTNIAQNDIREDCRYLKHRISNLERENYKLSSIVRQYCPQFGQQKPDDVHIKSSGQCSCLVPTKYTTQMNPTGSGSYHYFTPVDHRSPVGEDLTSEPDSSISPCLHRRFLPSDSPDMAFDDIQTCSPSDNGSAHQCRAIVQQGAATVSQGFRRHSTQFLEPATQPNLTWFGDSPYESDRTFFDAYVKPVIEGSMLRASSTPIIPIPDQGLAQHHFFPTNDDACSALTFLPYESPPGGSRGPDECGQLNLTTIPSPYLVVNQNQIRTGVEFRNTDRFRSDVPSYAYLTNEKANPPSCPKSLIPHGWIRMPVLPKSGPKRQPVGTRSHIILGARSLPLYLNASAEDLSPRGSSSRGSDRACSGIPTSPLARRHARAYSTHLRPIEEVDSNLQSFYDIVTSSIRTCASKLNTSVSRDEAEIRSELLPKPIEPSPLANIRRVLYRDPKRRYLHPVKPTLKTKPVPRPTNTKASTRQSFDLETLLYQQDQLQKCREAQRNLRYGVFSDTELLTGKFTITSRDDSAIESGEDEEEEDVQSSGESMVHIHLVETVSKENGDQVLGLQTRNNVQQLAHTSEITINSDPDGSTSIPGLQNAKQPSLDFTGSHSGTKSITEVTTEEDAEERRTTYLPVSESPSSQKSNSSDTDSKSRTTAAPPPVVIYRRKFGVPESTENDSTMPVDDAPRSQVVDEKNSTLLPTDRIPIDHHSSDTDILVYTATSKGIHAFPTYSANEVSSPANISRDTLTPTKSTEESDETLKLTSHEAHGRCCGRLVYSQELAPENRLIHPTVPITLTEVNSTKFGCQVHVTDSRSTSEVDTSIMSGNVEMSRLTQTPAAWSVNYGTVNLQRGSSRCSQFTKANMNPMSLLKNRPGTSPEVRRTSEQQLDYLARTRESAVRRTSLNTTSQTAKATRSQPNSPEDESQQNLPKCRVHVTSSSVTFGVTHVSSPKVDLAFSCNRKHTPTSEGVLKPLQKYATNYSQDNANRSGYSQNDRLVINDSRNSPKDILSPPPIPPRTSSRTHGLLAKAHSPVNATQTDYRVPKCSSLTPVLRANQRTSAADRVSLLSEALVYPEQPRWSQSTSPATSPKSLLGPHQAGRVSRKKVRINGGSYREVVPAGSVAGSHCSKYGYSYRSGGSVLQNHSSDSTRRAENTKGHTFTPDQLNSYSPGETYDGFDSRGRGLLQPALLYAHANGPVHHSPQFGLYHADACYNDTTRSKSLISARCGTGRWPPNGEAFEHYSHASPHSPQTGWTSSRPTNQGQLSYHSSKSPFNT
ncbi:hypothetical protein CRM22_001141 [Opisthorchis felineus]|uniref:Uncharacterized protein n=1 Tax=Opisthorchis felineus TaxID=147828 RepID=A0A4S2MBX9_OPIFE|nr:hypothetical protein CRM22_001141 [Opisthorchis felineus]